MQKVDPKEIQKKAEQLLKAQPKLDALGKEIAESVNRVKAIVKKIR
jgi:hypothetical protein